jgi:hypothetical protein
MADLSLFLNQGDRDFAVSRLNVDPVRCEIVPNGLPASFLQRPSPVSRDAAEPLRVAMIGTLLDRKEFSYAFGALRRLMTRYSALEVGLFGVGAGATPAIETTLGEAAQNRIKLSRIMLMNNCRICFRIFMCFYFRVCLKGLHWLRWKAWRADWR